MTFPKLPPYTLDPHDADLLDAGRVIDPNDRDRFPQPRLTTETVPRRCAVCPRAISAYDPPQKLYCSGSCASEAANRRRAANGPSPRRRVIHTCAWCGERRPLGPRMAYHDLDPRLQPVIACNPEHAQAAARSHLQTLTANEAVFAAALTDFAAEWDDLECSPPGDEDA